MGPVITEAACDRIMGVIEDARSNGAGTVLTGGERLGGELADGYYVAPTVFGNVDHASSLAQNEIFGPVLSLMSFADDDEVVAKANDSDATERRAHHGLERAPHCRTAQRGNRVDQRHGHVANDAVRRVPGLAAGSSEEGGRAGIESSCVRRTCSSPSANKRIVDQSRVPSAA
jgi:aldehyde dehydrogenase (NAD+)